MNFFAKLLRSPAEVAEQCRSDRQLRELALGSIAVIIFGGALFGFAVGAHRGGLQMLFAAAKIPLVLLVTLAIAAPLLHAIKAALGEPWPFHRIVALSLAAAARASLVLVALAPVVWLVVTTPSISYHKAAAVSLGAYALGGAFALALLRTALGRRLIDFATLAGFVVAFFVVGAQTAWSFRPYLGRPSTDHLPFVRDREGSFVDAVYWTGRSAVGSYDQSRSHRWQQGRSGDARDRSAM